MKTLSRLLSLAIITGALFTSCDSDDDGGGNTPTTIETNLAGTISEDRTLDATEQYTITSTVIVQEGVTLTIPAGTEIVSNEGTENYIAILQGGKIDVQGTADSPVIMRSNGSAGSWGGLVVCGSSTTTEGINATAEVGNLPYGGTNVSDDSGNIEYLIIKDAGAQINADSQFNGLTLYAVGTGTTINNVAIINGSDDGVEFFGGTVSPNNMYLENNEDDAVDWTEGWNGTLTTTYVTNTINSFSTAIEADGVNNNPTLINFTAISANGGTAIQIKNDSGATINGLTLTGFDTTFDFRDAAPVSNLMVDGDAADITEGAAYSTSSTNASLFAWVTNASDITGSALPANISSDLTLDASTTYTINGPVLVNSGATLTIPAGTNIVSQSGTANYIAILKGATIDIQGTEANPVVMNSDDGEAWGGLLICGNATTTEGVNAIAEVGGLSYGGSDDSDNSGSINYLILKDTGAQINADSQFNGLTLYAVGNGTTLTNIAVIGGADDGVEFFGGTVNLTNFYTENLQDDSVDWTEGWNGTLTNTFVNLTIDGFSTAIEADGVNNNPTIVNFTAVSTNGGTAVQIKNNSGCTITGLTLTGFDDQFDFRDNAPVSNVLADNANADETASYTTSTVVATDFSWATN